MSAVVAWSAQLQTPRARAEPLWLAVALDVWPLAARECLVRNPLTGATARLNADEHALLASCAGAKTLARHEADVAARFDAPAGDRAAIRRLLQRACELGLLVALDALVQRSDATAAPTTPCVVVVRTADRPQLLGRLLDSAATVERQFGISREWHVLDDSSDAAHRARNRDVVRASGLACTWHDLADAATLRGGLDAAFPDAKREIAWLLGEAGAEGARYGRPLNHALLLFAGKRWLAIDDDALLEARAWPSPMAGFAVGSGNDELFCYDGEAELLAAAAPLAIDPLAEHERWLGRSLASAWTAAAGGEGTADVDLAPDDALRFGRDARIAFTQNAAVGDPGSSLFPFHLLCLPPASLAHVAAHPARVAAAFGARHAWRGVRGLRLAPQRLLTFTTIAGLDNRLMLPPTVPVHRNEDLLLGGLAALVHPRAWFADLPFGLQHVRAEPKQWLPASAGFRQEPLHFVLDAVEARAGHVVAEAARDRMAALGAMLVDLAHAGERELVERLEAHAIETATRVVFSIRRQLDDAAVPPVWKDALRPWLASPALALEGEALRARLAPPAVVRELCGNHGAALAAWPALWDHCREAFA